MSAWDGGVPLVKRSVESSAASGSADPLEVFNRSCFDGNLQLVQLMLIEYGASVNRQGSKGLTPLMYASKGGSGAVIRYLLDCGADPDSKDVCGRTAFMHAAKLYKGQACATLFGAGMTISSERTRAGQSRMPFFVDTSWFRRRSNPHGLV